MPRLLDQVRERIRIKQYSIRTEEAYVDWARRFILWHEHKHPRDVGAAEVEAFLSWLATERGVVASTQNQAKGALLFLYREMLHIELPWLEKLSRCPPNRQQPIFLPIPFPIVTIRSKEPEGIVRI